MKTITPPEIFTEYVVKY